MKIFASILTNNLSTSPTWAQVVASVRTPEKKIDVAPAARQQEALLQTVKSPKKPVTAECEDCCSQKVGELQNYRGRLYYKDCFQLLESSLLIRAERTRLSGSTA
jgi:hypothetical protein